MDRVEPRYGLADFVASVRVALAVVGALLAWCRAAGW